MLNGIFPSVKNNLILKLKLLLHYIKIIKLYLLYNISQLYINLKIIQIPETTEIVWLQRKDENILGQFPGLFLFTGNARMMRPVINLDLAQIELIGTFEQVYLDISISEDEIRSNVSMTQI